MSNVTLRPGGTPVDALALVRVDNVTITGDGANVPLTAVGAGGEVQVDGTSIAGNGLPGTPLRTVADGTPVLVDNTSIAGNGTTGNALHTVDGGVAVVADGTTITGNGTTASPLVASGGGATVDTDGTSVGGNGTSGSKIHTIAGGTAVAVDGTTIVGNGTTGSPLAAVGGGGGGAVITNSTLIGAGTSGSHLGVLNAPLSVKAFGGAAGNGTTDDTTAIQDTITAAIAANVNVFFPPGTYLITSSLSTQDSTGLTFVANPGTATILYNSLTSTTGFTACNITGGTSWFTCYGVGFHGSISDDKQDNIFGAFTLLPGAADCLLTRSLYTYCGGQLNSDDSLLSTRCNFYKNVCHNCPSSVTVPSNSTIEDNDFYNDTAIPSGTHARAHFIYEYGSFQNVSIINNRCLNGSEEDIQIRASGALFNQKNQYWITGNYFENSQQGSIWCGGDSATDLGCFQVLGNRFKNCNGPIFVTGGRGSVIANNMCQYNWQLAQVCDEVIAISEGAGVGHFGQSDGPIISDNRIIIEQPYAGLMTIVSLPHDGDTVTIGAFTYTWRTVPTVAFDVLIDPSSLLRLCAVNFYLVMIAQDVLGLTTVPNNVLRNPLDCFIDDDESLEQNIVGVASWKTFAWSTASGGRITLGTVVDFTTMVGAPISVQASFAPSIHGNTFTDTNGGVTLIGNFAPSFDDNTFNVGITSQGVILASGNVLSRYKDINIVSSYLSQTSGKPYSWMSITDGFPVIEGCQLNNQQLISPAGTGRCGVTPIGNGKASTLFYYGIEVIDTDDAPDGTSATLALRWNDGDQVTISSADGTTSVNVFTFHRQSPGALQFNSADSLIALINASTGDYFSAIYEPFTNDLGGSAPKLMIRIFATAQGVAGNGAFVFVRRYASPTITSGSSWQNTPQPMMNGIILRNRQAGEDWATLAGGAATLVKTYIMSPIANPDRGVWVQGIDAASQALLPIVYQSDIIPGVGATITTTNVAAGTESLQFKFL